MHVQFASCCDCQPSYGRNVLIIVVIVFQLFKDCYSVQEYTCVNNHMIFNNGTETKFNQNVSFMIIESVNYKKMNPTPPDFSFYKNAGIVCET